MDVQESIVDIAHVIQLAVAPVFLLSAISGMLAVMTHRLSRIVDRARALESGDTGRSAAAVSAELELVSRRARTVNRAITLCTTTALMVASVIALLFVAAFLKFDASVAVAMLFIAAMLSFVGALLYFLREVFLSTHTLRFGRGGER